MFGAGLRRDGSPTAILRDRVQSAVELYKKRKSKEIAHERGQSAILDYNEPGAMREYAIGLGVPPKVISSWIMRDAERMIHAIEQSIFLELKAPFWSRSLFISPGQCTPAES